MNASHCLDQFMSICFIFLHEELKPTAFYQFPSRNYGPTMKTSGRLCVRKDDHTDLHVVPQAEGEVFLPLNKF